MEPIALPALAADREAGRASAEFRGPERGREEGPAAAERAEPARAPLLHSLRELSAT
jgi:hypothetical protein